MARTMTYVAMDGTRHDFKIPKGAARSLLARTLRKIHEGVDADTAILGLTEDERAFVFDVVATLEEHTPQEV